MYSKEYAHYLLFMYFPFRNKAELKFNNSFENKLSFPGVLDTINFNRPKVEPYASIVDDAFYRLQGMNQTNIDPFGQQKNDETYPELNEEMWNSEDKWNDVEPETQPFSEAVKFGNHRVSIFTDNVINKNMRSFNEKPRQVFDIIHKWSKDYIKNLNCKVSKFVTPFHIFVAGGAGVGKSHLIKTIHMSLSWFFQILCHSY